VIELIVSWEENRMATQWAVERLNPARITEADATAVAELNQLVWPQKNKTVEAIVGELLHKTANEELGPENAPIWFVVRDGSRLLVKAQTFAREIGTSQGPMTIMALCGVCARPDFRGRGLGQAVVRAALARVDAGEFAFSLFQTCRNNLPFYERLGAVVIGNRLINSRGENPEKNPFWDELAMRYPAQGAWPEGTIDLCGEAW
jgi:GNAT superfamily N-acetyltransferase